MSEDKAVRVFEFKAIIEAQEQLLGMDQKSPQKLNLKRDTAAEILRTHSKNGKTDLLHISTTEFSLEDLNTPVRLMVTVLRQLRLISWHTKADGIVRTNNFTLINFVLVIFGPVHERVVTQMLLGFQVLCTLIALTIRYPLANYFYTKT
ncbi:UDP-N-acetylglucosamine--dolichyl-phosphate N-acetylglucosaminephosphotransferase-like [Drosophila subpulchrella]|uniref:UDP-N-acetylglucosamine--dolichyl-phosphate N-acetylglucosaminephosphotransferase-like n=1 Tax=Drosophila subpulchrella TaxID=1486046 RepID=UPI0018A188E9|nr:UDP-N-acetylglucosamine--dolichyl-phosphate N-acetylglucosaminephosphotransferase-like [Drosophila subpulchrella]